MVTSGLNPETIDKYRQVSNMFKNKIDKYLVKAGYRIRADTLRIVWVDSR